MTLLNQSLDVSRTVGKHVIECIMIFIRNIISAQVNICESESEFFIAILLKAQ